MVRITIDCKRKLPVSQYEFDTTVVIRNLSEVVIQHRISSGEPRNICAQ